jgi:hypothetical protein
MTPPRAAHARPAAVTLSRQVTPCASRLPETIDLIAPSRRPRPGRQPGFRIGCRVWTWDEPIGRACTRSCGRKERPPTAWATSTVRCSSTCGRPRPATGSPVCMGSAGLSSQGFLLAGERPCSYSRPDQLTVRGRVFSWHVDGPQRDPASERPKAQYSESASDLGLRRESG